MPGSTARQPQFKRRAGIFFIPLLFFLPGVVARQALGALRVVPQDLGLGQAGEEPVPQYAWAPQLLDGIIRSANPAALSSLYDAAFAAGPSLVPRLEAALSDDRTAEFAAQSLAFIGGPQAKAILTRLVQDPRDLDLRRFYYGFLSEYDDAGDNQVLLDAIGNANHEPDRTVTEAAIVALTVRSDTDIVARLEPVEAKLTDLVIRDDLADAISIVRQRASYLASRGGRGAEDSIEQAIHLYFIPAIQSPAAAGRGVARARNSGNDATIKIEHVELSPDKMRALARVSFEDSVAIAQYQIVLEKAGGGWKVASVWLGSEQERPSSQPAA
jgi:hypothetical protein